MRVGYYYRRNKDLLFLVWRLHDWNARNLEAKGIRACDFVVARQMTRAEIEDYVEGQRRLRFTFYDHFKSNIRNFLDDERACGVSESFLHLLESLLHIHAPNSGLAGTRLESEVSQPANR